MLGSATDTLLANNTHLNAITPEYHCALLCVSNHGPQVPSGTTKKLHNPHTCLSGLVVTDSHREKALSSLPR